MLYAGLAIQILGIVLIPVGGFTAAREMGAVARWWNRAGSWSSALVVAIRRFVAGVVLRKREPAVFTVEPAIEVDRAGEIVLEVAEPDWDSLDHDEKMQMISRALDYYKRLVEERTAEAADRLDELQERLSEFESRVEERFGGHDARDQAILGFELAGGALSLLGTVLVQLA